jgi:hypothetical protein
MKMVACWLSLGHIAGVVITENRGELCQSARRGLWQYPVEIRISEIATEIHFLTGLVERIVGNRNLTGTQA